LFSGQGEVLLIGTSDSVNKASALPQNGNCLPILERAPDADEILLKWIAGGVIEIKSRSRSHQPLPDFQAAKFVFTKKDLLLPV
jgi:hypothetical protein